MEDSLSNKELVKQHYNSHASVHRNSREAVRQRAEGEAAPLKRFHNEIKRQLIVRFGYNADSLLDLACGRGGDLHKWKDAKIKYVKGVDISDCEVEEATKRFGEMKRRFPDSELEAEFEVAHNLAEEEWSDGQLYDVVTCMFALHYFFESEPHLKMFIKNVAANLKPGGYFLGTVVDGKRVLLHLHNKQVHESRMLRLERQWKGNEHERTPFSHAYLCAITDTVTEGRGVTTGSREFLTFTSPILQMAAHYGLYPMEHFNDERLDALFEPADQARAFKHFQPHFPGSDRSLEDASALNTAFVFQKVGPKWPQPPLHQPPPHHLHAHHHQQPPHQQPHGHHHHPPAPDHPHPHPQHAQHVPSRHASALRPPQQQQQQRPARQPHVAAGRQDEGLSGVEDVGPNDMASGSTVEDLPPLRKRQRMSFRDAPAAGLQPSAHVHGSAPRSDADEDLEEAPS